MKILKRTGPKSVIGHLGLPETSTFMYGGKPKKKRRGSKMPGMVSTAGTRRTDTIPLRQLEERNSYYYRSDTPRWRNIDMREMANFMSSRQPPPNFNRSLLSFTTAELNDSNRRVKRQEFINRKMNKRRLRDKLLRQMKSAASQSVLMSDILQRSGEFRDRREGITAKKNQKWYKTRRRFSNIGKNLKEIIQKKQEKVEKLEAELNYYQNTIGPVTPAVEQKIQDTASKLKKETDSLERMSTVKTPREKSPEKEAPRTLKFDGEDEFDMMSDNEGYDSSADTVPYVTPPRAPRPKQEQTGRMQDNKAQGTYSEVPAVAQGIYSEVPEDRLMFINEILASANKTPA